MTTQPNDQTPDREPLILAYEGFSPEAVRRALAPFAEHLARMRFRNAARAALTSCLSHDDDNAALALDGLDADQLKQIVDAASGLAIHASRRRKTLAQEAAQDDQDGEPGEGETLDCRSDAGITVGLIDGIIATARVLRTRDLTHPHVAEALTDLAADEDLARLCLDQDEEPERGPSVAGAYVDELADWERDLLNAKAAEMATEDEQPQEAGDEYDLDTDPDALRRDLNEVITALDGRGPKMTHDAVWARVRPVLRIHREKLTEQRHRADTAERQRDLWEADAKRYAGNSDQWRGRAHHWKAAAVSATDAFSAQRERAEVAERRADEQKRRADEQKKRAQRAEAEAADWRTTAGQYERQRDAADRLTNDLREQRDAAREDAETAVRQLNQAERELRAEQAEASLQVTRLTSERDDARDRLAKAEAAYAPLAARADATEEARARWQKRGQDAEATVERVRQFAADLRIQLRAGFPTGAADRLDKILEGPEVERP